MIHKYFTEEFSSLVATGILIPSMIGIALLTLIPAWQIEHVFFHGMLELLGALCAFFVVLLVGAKQSEFRFSTPDTLCISAALVSTSILAIFHAFSPLGTLFIWLHSVATLTGGMFFAAVWLPTWFSKQLSKTVRNVPIFIAFTTLVLALWSSNYPEWLPRMIVEGQFTPAAKGINLVGGIGYSAASFYFLKQYKNVHLREYLFLSLYSLFFFMAGMLFVFASNWGAVWWFLHVIQFIANLGLLLFFVQGVYVKLDASDIDYQYFLPKGTTSTANSATLGKAMGIFTILLGSLVLTGWYQHSTTLIQVMPQFAPMQFNTALVILLGGIGVLANYWNQRKIVFATGAIIASVGLLTLIEYVLDLDFRIDQLMIDGYITVRTTHVGRMSQNTSICAFLIGMALLFLSSMKYHKLSRTTSQLFVLVAFSIATISFLGYFLDGQQRFRPEELTKMAIHTSIGFIALSTGLLAFSTTVRNERIATIPLWLPGVLYIVVFIIDFYTPKGVAACIAYVPLVCCAFWFVHPSTSFMFALVSTVLIIIGYFVSPAGNLIEEGTIVNRLLSIVAVWVMAFVVNLHRYADIKRHESERRYRISLEGSAAGVWDWNIVKKNFYSSERFKEILGIKDENDPITLKILLKRIHAADRKEVINRLRWHLKYRKKYNLECQLVHTTGKAMWIHLRGQAVWDERNNPTRMAGSIEDITERKYVENELAHRIQELNNSNQALDDFAYIACHDLREPLRGINAHAHAIVKKFTCNMDKLAKNKLNRIISLTQHIDDLVNDLFQFSRLEKTQLAVQKVDIGKLVDSIAGEILVSNEREKIQFSISRALPIIVCDRVRTNIIFQNIIANAIKYNDSKIKRIQIGCMNSMTHNEKLLTHVFWVRDNGIGIDKVFFSEIFRIFKRLNSEKTYGKGTGAGLTFVKKIIEQQGGVIWLRSAPRKGSIFHFTLSGE